MSDQRIGNAQINLGFESAVYAKAETVYGQAILPESGNAIRHLSVDLGYTIEEKPREDKSSHRGIEDFIQGRGSGEWSLECYVSPSGTAGTTPDIESLLTGIFETRGEISASTIEASPTPTTDQFDIDDASEMAVNDLLLVPIATPRVVRIYSIDTNTLIVAPALPSAPVGGESISPALVYQLTTKPISSFTIARKGSFFCEWAAGCWVNNFTLNIPSGDEPKLTLSGGYADKSFAFQATLAAEISDETVTSMTVGESYGFRASSTVPAWVRIDDEVIKITAVDYETGVCDIARGQEGTGPASHAEGSVVYPYMPAAAPGTAQPATGLLGSVRFLPLDLYVTEVEISINNKCKAVNGPFGTSVPQGFVTGAKREVTAKIGLYLTQNQSYVAGLAFGRTDIHNVMVQVGTAAGSVLALAIPTLHLKPFDIPTDTAEEIVVSLEGTATAAGANEELFLAFL